MEKLQRIPYFGSRVLLAYMPFHIFLSQSLSLLTGGLDAWKVGKDVALMLLVLFTICLVWAQGRATRLFNGLVLCTAAYGALHMAIWAMHPHIYAGGAMLGTIYNMRPLLCLLLGTGAVLLLPKFAFSSVIKLVLSVSTLVAVLGILQYMLPSDILSHVGYSLQRGVRAAFFIDDNPAYPRIMSTLREPNALGAYLILPMTALMLLFFEVKTRARRWLTAGAFGLHAFALLLTFSRSAWVAAIVAIVLAICWRYSAWISLVLKRFWLVGVAAILLIGIGLYATRGSAFVHQYIVHSNQKKTNNLPDSDAFHTLFVEQGLKGITAQPLGHGPGTAGLVSIHNPDGGQLTENYYVQIGYEVGVLGALLFIGLNAWLYIRLWRRRDIYGLVLCASFWAYVITNMLLHTWSNEAVVAQWWIVAGMALVAPVLTTKKRSKIDPKH